MNRTMFFVDGFNLYHSVKELRNNKYKWLDIDKLCRHFLNRQLAFSGIKYFTAYSTWDQDAMQRHKIYIRALDSKGIDVIYGKFKVKEIKCKVCHKIFTVHEEKQTDVNIALTLFENAHHDNFDTAIIVSGDTDLLPTIKCMKQHFTNKNIWFLFPMNRAPEELKTQAHHHMKIKEKHLMTCQFPDNLDIGQGVILNRPDRWK